MNHNSSDIPTIPLLYSSDNNQNQHNPRKRPNKVHVSAACVNCKKAHLACDVSRPCQRCVATDKADTCHDIQHKKRGRPKMPRDSNNNKIRPISTTPTNINNYRLVSFPTSDSSSSSNDLLTIILSMDLCCARVSDESLEFLQLYPQEFSHRSIYDFLVPGESHQSMSKLHRCLLDNAAQRQQKKSPPNAIRSCFDGFFSTPIHDMLNIANGSLTLKQKFKFRCGSGHQKREEEMNCKLYLGGGFGADLFETSSLQQLYIVCILSPSSIINRRYSAASASYYNSMKTTESPITVDTAVSVALAATPATAVSLTATSSSTSMTTTPTSVSLSNTPMFNLPPLILNDSSSTSPTTTNYSYTEGEEDDREGVGQEDPDYNDEYFCVDDDIDEDLMRANLAKDSFTTTEKDKKKIPTIKQEPQPPPPPEQQSSLLDKFRYKVNRSKQFIHPNELYYKNISSSRLSSEAIAHTAHPYLSARLTDSSFNTTGSSSLAAYNQSLSNSNSSK